MGRIYTIIYRLSGSIGKKSHKEASEILKKSLRNELAPSERCISNIMAFAEAYQPQKTESMGTIDFMAN